jgi:hypothetical protein
MQTSTIKLNLSKEQSVTKENVTPAEVAYYIAEHHNNFGKNPVELVGEVTEIERSSKSEIERLYTRFPSVKIKALYPNALANIPVDFDAAMEIGMGTSLPTERLMTHDASR